MVCVEKQLIHQYLDEDIDEQSYHNLQEHLRTCQDCRQHMLELQKTIAYVQSLSHVRTPDDFTERVMARLPAPTQSWRLSKWLRQHPFLVAAAIFLFLMAGSVISAWFDSDQTLQVSSNNFDQLYIDHERKMVVVPEGVKVEGDLIVRNANVEVKGEVAGKVVAIEGKVITASTAVIAGEVESIEAIFQWIWYELKNIGNNLLPLSP